ncbi:MAG: DUF1947 domain-containing protein [Crenarchaeota archaeon]|nr:DUF1947 domain-containing protein [Thermoproteota archaeon]
MRRWVISKSERKRLLERLSSLYPGLGIGRDARIEVVVEEDVKAYLIDGIPAFYEAGDGTLIPLLFYLLKRGYRGWLPYIVVDEGAVRPISRGADLMRPGIVEVGGDFDRGAIVVIVDPNHRLPLAVHRSLYSSEEIKAMERGRVSKCLHHVGDRYWRMFKGL